MEIFLEKTHLWAPNLFPTLKTHDFFLFFVLKFLLKMILHKNLTKTIIAFILLKWPQPFVKYFSQLKAARLSS